MLRVLFHPGEAPTADAVAGLVFLLLLRIPVVGRGISWVLAPLRIR